jgi:hypothetical protein
MSSLPMVPPACSLDETNLRAQLARYRDVGTGSEILEQTRQRLVIRLGSDISDIVVEELVAIERHCCPFFSLDWEPTERRLSIGVSTNEDEPALDAIAYAWGLGVSRGGLAQRHASEPRHQV